MANAWMNIQPLNNENGGHLAASRSKQMLSSARSHSVKKQAFGELKNVMHNQYATPFRGGLGGKPDNFPGMLSASKSLCPDVLRKQQLKHKLDSQVKPINVAYTGQKSFENLYDYWDNPSLCCTKMCHKTEEQIWSEMNTIDEALLDKIIKGGDPDTDTECENNLCLYEDHDECIPAIPMPLFEYGFDKDGDDDITFTLEIPNFPNDFDDLMF